MQLLVDERYNTNNLCQSPFIAFSFHFIYFLLDSINFFGFCSFIITYIFCCWIFTVDRMHSWRKFGKRGPRRDWVKPLRDQISRRFPAPPVRIILHENEPNVYLLLWLFHFYVPYFLHFKTISFPSEIAGMSKSESANKLSEVTSFLYYLLIILFILLSLKTTIYRNLYRTNLNCNCVVFVRILFCRQILVLYCLNWKDCKRRTRSWRKKTQKLV